MMNLFGLTILDSGVNMSMLCAVVGLVFAFVLIGRILRLSPGNERMQQIAAAIQEGAKAYLNRQVVTISVIAAIIFVLLFF
ncbi:MAG: K(+)-stimulated pyrophosphate-energized sodium pump, partial [Verrucomicrobiota bacterium]